MNDVKSWPTVITGGNSPEFADALRVGNAVKGLVDIGNTASDIRGYSVSTTGHSWGEGLAQIQSYTFGWTGTGFDGVGLQVPTRHRVGYSVMGKDSQLRRIQHYSPY